jgi:hypothetical protein
MSKVLNFSFSHSPSIESSGTPYPFMNGGAESLALCRLVLRLDLVGKR